jgi:hypothetical protein
MPSHASEGVELRGRAPEDLVRDSAQRVGDQDIFFRGRLARPIHETRSENAKTPAMQGARMVFPAGDLKVAEDQNHRSNAAASSGFAFAVEAHE